MQDALDSSQETPPEWVEPPPAGRPVIAWCVILVVVVFAVYLRVALADAEARGDGPVGRAGLWMSEVQSKYLVGAASLLPQEQEELFREAGTWLNSGSVDQRLRFVVLAGEMVGPSESLTLLDQLTRKMQRHDVEPTAIQKAIYETLERLYRDYDEGKPAAPSLAAADRALLKRELGWFGRLALAPEDGPAAARRPVLRAAYRRFVVILASVGWFGLLGVVGAVGLIVTLVLLATGYLRRRLVCGSAHGAVYAETFALWLLLFFLLNVAVNVAPVQGSRMPLFLFAFLLSLAALAWPVSRGAAWREVRQEIGLTCGRGPILETAIGFATYAMSLPLLVLGLLLTLVLVVFQSMLETVQAAHNEFAPTSLPFHPVVEDVAGAGWWGWFQVLLVACVAAPIVEETMFRGVLYRHLREGSRRMGTAPSVLFSTTLGGFLFAVVHPQGYVAVPALMALAYGFALAREWRGTLWPSIVAHGLSNGVILTLLILLLSG